MSRAVDLALEATVAGSFTRIGCRARRRVAHWTEPGRLDGRTVLVTGATSGIGEAAATAYARLGATVRFLARDQGRAEQARARMLRQAPDADIAYDLADLADLDSVRDFAGRFAGANPELHVLLHNAGTLHREFGEAPGGTERTLAGHVLGPFLLTGLLAPLLSGPARVLTMSSGGMYTQRFELDELEVGPDGYDGTTAYARAKRAQVVLNGEWARRVPPATAVFHALHPGWVDTPGIAASLPGFHRTLGPLLRSPEEGADTAVWLASAPEALASTGRFWHDRRPRWEHRLPWTLRQDDPARLWACCAERTGWDLRSA